MLGISNILLAFSTISTVLGSTDDKTAQKRALDQSSYAEAYPQWNGYRGGANSLINVSPDADTSELGIIVSASRGETFVQKVSDEQAGFLRVQVYYDELLKDDSLANGEKISTVLQRVLQKGSDLGVYVVVTLRSSDNGGGGNILQDQQLADAMSATEKLVHLLISYPNFIFGTFNEGAEGGSTPQTWANMMTGLIEAARNASFTGFIAIDDSHWGGGLLDGDDSGIATYVDELSQANGGNVSKLIGSFHCYVSQDWGVNATDLFKKELDAVVTAGMLPAVLEYGNANYGNYEIDGKTYVWEKRQAGITALHDNLQNLIDAGGIAIPWYEMLADDAQKYTNDSIRGFGYISSQQVLTTNSPISAPS